MNKYIYVFLAVLLTIAIAFGLFNYGNSTKSVDANAGENSGAVVIDKSSSEFKKTIAANNEDFYLGSENAPVTIIEYASLSCSHCAHFHENVVEPLIESHVNKGKVKYILRDFPLNPPALEASLITRCFGKMRYFSLTKALFLSQDSWINNSYKIKLQAILKPLGIDEAKYNECIGNKQNEAVILKSRQDAETIIGVNSTPTIYINGIEYTGTRTYSGVKKFVDDLLAGHEK